MAGVMGNERRLRRCLVVVVAGVALVSSGQSGNGDASPPGELVLERALPIDGPGRFQPSGLVVREGELWTVSDKHGAAVYHLKLDTDRARAVEIIADDVAPVNPARDEIDAEGLAFAPDGSLYLASEEYVRAFVLRPATLQWTAATVDLSKIGRTVGLFEKKNAKLEGIAVLGDDTLILAAERARRGLIEVDGIDDPRRVVAQAMEASSYPSPANRTLDFADLTVWHGRLFALSRNQHLVVELTRDSNGVWSEGAAWSYAQVENAPEYRYRDRTFGLAEGLAIDDRHIYVVLDNNDDTRESTPDDARPQLFIFQNPLPP